MNAPAGDPPRIVAFVPDLMDRSKVASAAVGRVTFVTRVEDLAAAVETDATDATTATDGTDTTGGTGETDATSATDGTDETGGTDATVETDATDATTATDGTDATSATDETGRPRAATLVVVDLGRPGVVEVLPLLAAFEPRPIVIGFGSHVDREQLADARRAGADRVLARSAFFADLATLLA